MLNVSGLENHHPSLHHCYSGIAFCPFFCAPIIHEHIIRQCIEVQEKLNVFWGGKVVETSRVLLFYGDGCPTWADRRSVSRISRGKAASLPGPLRPCSKESASRSPT